MSDVENVHARDLPVAAEAAQSLLRMLAAKDDLLWPWARWPAMRFKDGLIVGAHGGHGPIRYRIEAIEPSRIQFAFTGPRGFDGFHRYELDATGDARCRLTHRLRMRTSGPALLTWPLLFRPLHDALIEDSLDRAEAWARGTAWQKRPLGAYVRMLRAAARLIV
jgi:hypothetical protein